jgi:aconitate hydratase
MTATADLTISGQHHRIIDLPTEAGASLDRLPHILRIMLENVLRNAGEDARRPRPRS